MNCLSSLKTPQNHLWSLIAYLHSSIVLEEFGHSTSDVIGAHDKTTGQPFCTVEGCPQGGVQGGTP